MKRLTLLLCAGLVLGLSACTDIKPPTNPPITTPPTTDPPPTDTPPTDTPPPTNPNPPTNPPTNPPVNPPSTAPFLPSAGAAVGSGNGTPEGTVYVSPSAQEIEVLKLINEVRTTGKINGADATSGTCVDGKFTPLKPLSYGGALSYMARKHSEYMSNVGYEFHNETNTGSPYFYGATIESRKVRAYTELGVTIPYSVGEIVVAGRVTADRSVRDWMLSPGHCNVIMLDYITVFGAGYAYAAPDTSNHKWGDSWTVTMY